MYIDKIIKREVMTLIISVVILLTVFIAVSFSSFMTIKDGKTNVINYGDLEIKFCSNTSCSTSYENFGQVIGTSTTNGKTSPISIYPYASSTEALATTPYIFNIKNTGLLEAYLTVKLVEDTDFIPMGSYAEYTSTTKLYSNHIKIGVNKCTNGTINRAGITEYVYGELENNRIITYERLASKANQTYCLWIWLDENTPNEVQSTYFVANLDFSADYKSE